MGRHRPSSQLHYMYMLLYILCTIVFRPTVTTLLYCLLVGYAMQQYVRTVGAGGIRGSMVLPEFGSRELYYSLMQYKGHNSMRWPFYNHFLPFFANYINIFLKTEVQIVILRSLTVQKLLHNFAAVVEKIAINGCKTVIYQL